MSELDWREGARRFAVEKIVPIAEQIDREGTLPPGIVHGMAEEGFFGLTIPVEYGGADASTMSTASVLEEIAAASLAVATNLAVHLSVASAPIVRWGNATQKEKWLPRMARGEWLGAFALTEPGAGSDARHLATRYAKEGSGYRLSGTKTFITNGGKAQVVLVFATRDITLEARGISCFLVEKGVRGFSVSRHLEKLGLWGSETTELLFEDCPVGEDALLGGEGNGFKVAMTALEGGRVGISATSLGVAQAALQLMRENVHDSSEEWLKGTLARSYGDVEAARALVEQAARLRDANEDHGLAASVAKLFASQVAFRVASKTLDVLHTLKVVGKERALAERLFRDSRVLTIVEGTTEIQEMILGKRLASPGDRS